MFWGGTPPFFLNGSTVNALKDLNRFCQCSESGCIRKIRENPRKFYLLDNTERRNYDYICFNFGQVWFRVYNPKGE